MNQSGNQKRAMRSAARLYAVQALFQMEHSDQSIDKVREQFEDHRFGEQFDEYEMIEGDMKTFRSLLERAVASQNDIDQMTDRALAASWPIDRIDQT